MEKILLSYDPVGDNMIITSFDQDDKNVGTVCLPFKQAKPVIEQLQKIIPCFISRTTE